MGRARGGSDEGVPRDEPQGQPRDLHPTSDIRFVIVEVSKLEERVSGLTSAVEKLPSSFEKAFDRHAADVKDQITELKSDSKEHRNNVHDIQKSISFVKGAMWVFGGLFTIALIIMGILLRAKFVQ